MTTRQPGEDGKGNADLAKRRWFSEAYRRNLVDMHIDDWDLEFLSRFDGRVYADLLERANVQVGMIYANSHVGLCNWPTRSGQMHRGLQGRDILGETIRECTTRGIRVVVYYSLIYNNRVYDEHPDWRIRDQAGRSSREAAGPAGFLGRRYGVVCPNNPSYRDFVVKQIREICEGYEFDGIFFDMNFWPDFCYCASCRMRYEQEVGGAIPTRIDWDDPSWRTFQTKREEWIAEFGKLASDTAKECMPGVSTEHNSAGLMSGWQAANTLRMLEANDYLGGDLYGGTLSQSFICKLFRSITPNMPFEYMVSRCYPTLRDHTTTKSDDMLEQQSFYALAHGGAFLFIDAIDPDGQLDSELYERVGRLFERSAGFEPYLDGEPCEDVAVLYSLDSKMDVDAPAVQVGDPKSFRFAVDTPHFDAALGAVRALKEAHVPLGVISTSNMQQLQRHRVVIVPDIHVLATADRDLLLDYVREGGNLYLSGSSIRFFAEAMGVRYLGRVDQPVSYIQPVAGETSTFDHIHPRAPLALFEHQRKVALQQDFAGRVSATVSVPYTDSSDLPKEPIVQIFDDAEVVGDRFASIHSNPPGPDTGIPAVLERRVGRGRIVWVAGSIEKPDKHRHKETFVRCIRDLLGDEPAWDAEAPAAVEILVHHRPEDRQIVVSAVNTMEVHPPTEAHGVRVRVRVKDTVSEVRAIPSGESLPYLGTDGWVTVELPPVRIAVMAVIQS